MGGFRPRDAQRTNGKILWSSMYKSTRQLSPPSRKMLRRSGETLDEFLLRSCSAGEFVDSVIVHVAAVTLNPAPFQQRKLEPDRIELHPQRLVLNRGSRGRYPPICLPAVDPLGSALSHILAIE